MKTKAVEPKKIKELETALLNSLIVGGIHPTPEFETFLDTFQEVNNVDLRKIKNKIMSVIGNLSIEDFTKPENTHIKNEVIKIFLDETKLFIYEEEV